MLGQVKQLPQSHRAKYLSGKAVWNTQILSLTTKYTAASYYNLVTDFQ